ncbi:MAG: AMP-dependent synthetase and ligase [Actinomycetia bacterium]|nr:AMP-dependent synthetase and ligase [Actinomycetes bacterium]
MNDDLPTTIPGVLARAAERFADREALVDERARLTFAQLADAAATAGRAVIASGMQPGDRVAIWGPNTTEWVIAALGIYSAGCVVVPLNTRFKGNEATYILERADARMLFTVTDFLDTNYVEVLQASPPVPSLEHVVTLRGAPNAGTSSWDDFLGRAEGASAADLADRTNALTGGDLSDVLFTSGTTGKPKGAMLSHGASVRAYTAWSDVVGLREGDRYLIINPFFHGFGLKAGILASLLKGATIIPHAVFDVDTVMQRTAEERITMLPGPPTIYQSILDHPRLAEFDMSTLRLSVTGAAAVPVELIRRMRSELSFETIVTGYGLTEATGIATMCRHDDDPETIATTAGRAIPDVEVRVIDDDQHPLPPGEPGEVVVRGYNIMLGFIHDPEATAEAIDTDGWLHTGDIGVLDERGNLRITDRKKDMYIYGGFNAYPAEIENMVLEHPAVAQVAIVGVPDVRMGEVGYAFVILRLGASMEAEELVTWCRKKMANYKVPRYVEIVDAFPLNAIGKVLKYELRDKANATLGGT